MQADTLPVAENDDGPRVVAGSERKPPPTSTEAPMRSCCRRGQRSPHGPRRTTPARGATKLFKGKAPPLPDENQRRSAPRTPSSHLAEVPDTKLNRPVLSAAAPAHRESTTGQKLTATRAPEPSKSRSQGGKG